VPCLGWLKSSSCSRANRPCGWRAVLSAPSHLESYPSLRIDCSWQASCGRAKTDRQIARPASVTRFVDEDEIVSAWFLLSRGFGRPE
jgi:hypothetical protein